MVKVMKFKQKQLKDFLNKPEKKKDIKNIIIPHEYRILDPFIKMENDQAYLHIKENGIRKLVCKINKDQLMQLQSLNLNISPEKIREIFSDIDDSQVYQICEAIIHLLRNKSDNKNVFEID